MKKFIQLSLMLCALTSTIVSCGSPPNKAEPASTDPGTNTGFADNTALYLTVTSKWDPADQITTHGSCSFSSLEPQNTTKNCRIKIPEGQMYHSAINFVVGSKISQLCPMLIFKPYVYRISNSDSDYTPNGETTPATCSTTPDDIACFGGAVTQFLGPSYPEFTFQYFMTAAGENYTFTLPSENTTRLYSSKPKKKNFLATNNMSYADRATGQAGQYVAGTMEDYKIMCVDLWYHPIYTINLVIDDEDSLNSPGTLDEIDDWNGTFNF